MAIIYGTNMSNYLMAGQQGDTIYGWSSSNAPGDEGPVTDSDSLNGGSGDDTLHGGNGDDWLHGYGGFDRLYGGGGNDRVEGSRGVFDGGDGFDMLGMQTYAWKSTVELSIAAPDVPCVLEGGTSIVNFEWLQYRGGPSQDLITGGDFADRIETGEGDDVVNGGLGDDYIDAGSGFDTVYAGGGNDVVILAAVAGPKVIDGGSGFDHLTFGVQLHFEIVIDFSDPSVVQVLPDGTRISNFEEVFFFGYVYNDVITAGQYGEYWGGEGDDVLSASPDYGASLVGDIGDDTLLGGNGDDALDGGQGYDIIRGGGGDDMISDNVGDFDGGDGVDLLRIDVWHLANGVTLSFATPSVEQVLSDGTRLSNIERARINLTNRDDTVTGGQYDDTFYGNWGNDTLTGGDGNDELYGDLGSDSLIGGNGNDKIYGGIHNDLLVGGAGDDSLYGAGEDRIEGGGGDDFIDAGFGVSVVFGGEGNDYVKETGAAGDRLNGGGGIDVLAFDRSATAEQVVLTIDDPTAVQVLSGKTMIVNFEQLFVGGSSADDRITGGALADTIRGFGGNDRLEGGLGADLLEGGTGTDLLVGGGGNDELNGGADNDTLAGSSGTDVLTGGAGADTFSFLAVSDSGRGAKRDKIADFVSADLDRIDLSQIDAIRGRIDDAFHLVGGTGQSLFSGLGTVSAGELRYFRYVKDTIIQGDTNGDGAADFSIALAGIHRLQATDFIL